MGETGRFTGKGNDNNLVFHGILRSGTISIDGVYASPEKLPRFLPKTGKNHIPSLSIATLSGISKRRTEESLKRVDQKRSRGMGRGLSKITTITGLLPIARPARKSGEDLRILSQIGSSIHEHFDASSATAAARITPRN